MTAINTPAKMTRLIRKKMEFALISQGGRIVKKGTRDAIDKMATPSRILSTKIVPKAADIFMVLLRDTR